MSLFSTKSISYFTILLFTVCFLTSNSPSFAAQEIRPLPGDYTGELMFNGLNRSYQVHIPLGYRLRSAMPLVIALHGGGGNAENSISTTGLNQKSDQEGFIVVHPNGTANNKLLTWNAHNCCGDAYSNNIDDVGFISALIDELVRTLNIDRKKVYVTGFSNGAMLAYKLACQLANKIAAIAVVSGALNTDSCKASETVPVVIFHGTYDQNILYNGGAPRKGFDPAPRVDKPVSFAVSSWVNNNQCSSRPITVTKGSIKGEAYRNCKNNADVTLYTVIGGGHAWPGGNKAMSGGDQPTNEISATNTMWEFFKAHPKI
jgi:polyhydroxybutyrate depolymerase